MDIRYGMTKNRQRLFGHVLREETDALRAIIKMNVLRKKMKTED